MPGRYGRARAVVRRSAVLIDNISSPKRRLDDWLNHAQPRQRDREKHLQ